MTSVYTSVCCAVLMQRSRNKTPFEIQSWKQFITCPGNWYFLEILSNIQVSKTWRRGRILCPNALGQCRLLFTNDPLILSFHFVWPSTDPVLLSHRRFKDLLSKSPAGAKNPCNFFLIEFMSINEIVDWTARYLSVLPSNVSGSIYKDRKPAILNETVQAFLCIYKYIVSATCEVNVKSTAADASQERKKSCAFIGALCRKKGPKTSIKTIAERTFTALPSWTTTITKMLMSYRFQNGGHHPPPSLASLPSHQCRIAFQLRCSFFEYLAVYHPSSSILLCDFYLTWEKRRENAELGGGGGGGEDSKCTMLVSQIPSQKM